MRSQQATASSEIDSGFSARPSYALIMTSRFSRPGCVSLASLTSPLLKGWTTRCIRLEFSYTVHHARHAPRELVTRLGSHVPFRTCISLSSAKGPH